MLYPVIVFNLVFFVATVASGGFTLPNLLRLGAKYGPLIASGEWQRLLICIFLHGNVWHLFFNTYALFQLGRLVEGIYGYRKFFVAYVLSGLSGSFLSYLVNFRQIGVGASGAIFGLAGLLFAGGLKYRNTSLHRLGMGILPFIFHQPSHWLHRFRQSITLPMWVGFSLVWALGGFLLPGFRGFLERWGDGLLYGACIVFVALSVATFFLPGLSQRAVSLEGVIAFHNRVRDILVTIEGGEVPSRYAVESLHPPDREARKIKELLKRFLEEGNGERLEEVEEVFLRWRRSVLKKYEGIVFERESE